MDHLVKRIEVDGHPVTIHFAEESDPDLLRRIESILLSAVCERTLDFGQKMCDNVVLNGAYPEPDTVQGNLKTESASRTRENRK